MYSHVRRHPMRYGTRHRRDLHELLQSLERLRQDILALVPYVSVLVPWPRNRSSLGFISDFRQCQARLHVASSQISEVEQFLRHWDI